ncbi:MAG: type II toxin-antitoxin system RelE/ParE family toxin [Verrucomicrobia bacterium]|nr:type II toxin-antitoxin system RelE/ParE family toxin [Verrucomicrobiota bacterium]MDA1006070.1 type II toxin-antitoxin system RelE/ParE family toxin [Verrucomicrobiota bacterium]
MRPVFYHRHAVRYLRRMPADRKAQVKAAVGGIAALEDPLSHANVKALGGEWSGCLRLRVGRYRAIFHLLMDEGDECLEVLQIGPRGDVY